MEQTVYAGQEVLNFLHAERERLVPHSKRPNMEQYFESEPLCQWQTDIHYRGYRHARIQKSAYGYSVRSGSGLENFMLLASSRQGQLDGTLEDALRFAREWQAVQPELRYVTD